MGHLGFSYVGALFLLMLWIPNLLWSRRRPQGYSTAGESRLLGALERVGQVLVTCILLIFSDFNLRAPTPRTLFLAAALAAMLLYELWWVRYFRSDRSLSAFYGDFLGIPVPGALLPVLAVFLLGFYGGVVLLPLAAAVLGIGHVGIHWRHRQDLRS